VDGRTRQQGRDAGAEDEDAPRRALAISKITIHGSCASVSATPASGGRRTAAAGAHRASDRAPKNSAQKPCASSQLAARDHPAARDHHTRHSAWRMPRTRPPLTPSQTPARAQSRQPAPASPAMSDDDDLGSLASASRHAQRLRATHRLAAMQPMRAGGRSRDETRMMRVVRPRTPATPGNPGHAKAARGSARGSAEIEQGDDESVECVHARVARQSPTLQGVSVV